MRALAVLVLASMSLFADDKDSVVSTVQKLFDAMAAHDSDAARAVIVGEGRLYSTRSDGKISAGMTLEQFAAQLSASKNAMLERMWNPTVLVRGGIAQVWAEYDFHLNGKFHHCGIDDVSLVKGPEGWKIVGITYTSETNGCASSPLGPPKSAASSTPVLS